MPQKLRAMKSAEQLQDIDQEAGQYFWYNGFAVLMYLLASLIM